MQRRIIALGAVLVTGMFPAAALAQSTSTNETSDYGPGSSTTSTTQQAPAKKPSVKPANTTSTSSAPTSAVSPSTSTSAPATTPSSAKSLAFTGSDVWRGLLAGMALLAAAAFVVVPRRRHDN